MTTLTERYNPAFFERMIYALGIILLIPVAAALALGREYIIWYYAASVVASILIAFPRVCLYLFLLSVSVFMPYYIGRAGIHPFDICFFILAASLCLGFLLRGQSHIVVTPIDRYFRLLIAATVLSAVFAFDVSYSIVPCARIVVVFIAFRIVYGFALELGPRRLVSFYIYHVFVLSLINLALFLKSGGQVRIFGPAWLAFETYSMTALPMALAFLLWAERPAEKIKYGAIGLTIGLALLATQSRAPLLAVLIAVPVLLAAAYWKTSAGKRTSFLSVLRKAAIPTTIMLIIAILLRETLLQGLFVRVESFIEALKHPQETVYLRMVLWTAALKAFAANPITGVGIGNFKIVGQVVAEMKFSPVWYYISGMSAHNVILHYMAETGILGTLSVVALAGVNLRIAFRSLKRSVSAPELQMSAANFMAIFVFCVTIFYMRAWTWGQGGYIMALLFAFSVAWNYTLERKRKLS
ncbi:MAG: O-antigen ligase family protein [Candidatus Zixiibacteriota bacterium]|nr:MAG: O-antigen ligase family protein [candidate division Zixibacteria bacterium]